MNKTSHTSFFALLCLDEVMSCCDVIEEKDMFVCLSSWHRSETKCVCVDNQSPAWVRVKNSGLQNTVAGDVGGDFTHLMVVRQRHCPYF